MLNNETAEKATEYNETTEGNVDRKFAIVPTAQSEIVGLDTEGFDYSDFVLPRIKLMQPMSSEVVDGDAIPGDWLNTLSGQSYGTKLDFVVVSRWKSRTLFGENRDDEPLCRSPNGIRSVEGDHCATSCPYDAHIWRDKIPPACAEALNYLIIPHDEQFPAIVSFMRSSYIAGRTLNTLLEASWSKVAWAWKYELVSVKKTGPKGTYYIASVRKKIVDGKPVETNEEMQQLAEHFFGMAKAGKVNVDGGGNSNANG